MANGDWKLTEDNGDLGDRMRDWRRKYGHLLILAAWILFMGVLFSYVAYGQLLSQQVVFQSAYQRQFAITNCSNTTPIVVTVQAPAANEVLSFVPLDDDSLVTIINVTGNTACNVTNQVINVLTPTTFELTGVAGNGTYTGGGIGISDTLSAALPSPPVPNIGQGGHLISVEFPDENVDVSPVQVRIEAADTCPDPPFCTNGDWRPISVDVVATSTPLTGGNGRFNMVRANGAWRAIRVNSLDATPGMTMRVDYTGSPFPIGAVTCTTGLTGFCELETPFGGSGGAARATFAICLGTPCVVDTNITNRVIVTGPIALATCFAQAKTAPTGADLVFDILHNGATSIFVPGGNIRIPAGQNVAANVQTFALGSATINDFYTINITQVGSGDAGQDVTVVCTYQ